MHENCKQLGVLNVLFGMVVIRFLLSSVVVSLDASVQVAPSALSGPPSSVSMLVNVQNVLAGAG